jgi:hypothetical protein
VDLRKHWFAHLRAVLVALHLLAITIMAFPSPGEGMFRAAWKDPTVQGEFATWSARFNQLGVAVTPEEFEDRVWALAVRYTQIHNELEAPFADYYAACGTMQSWRMFAGPQRYPIRLEIDVRAAGTWRLVYRQRDPEHSWRAWQLDHYRVRPVLYRFGWYRYGGENEDLNGFVRWLGRRAVADFPDATALRVRFYQQRTPSPAEVRSGHRPEGEYVKDVTVKLKPYPD